MNVRFGSLAHINHLQLIVLDVALYQPIQYSGGAGFLYQRGLL